MRRFAQLYRELDQTTRTNEKVAALKRYFAQAPPEDAAWALAVLTGRKLGRSLPRNRLRAWASEVTGYPDWLVDESHGAVGDLSETLALLLPEVDQPSDEPLHQVVTERVLPLPNMTETAQRKLMLDTWASFDTAQRFLFHKLISQSFRVGVAKKLVIRALAEHADMEPAVMAHRLTANWQPTADDYLKLIDPGATQDDPGQPYPFYLASPLEQEAADLGDPDDWHAEWKWDGIRAQLIRRRDRTLLWSRGEELITDAFPELEALGQGLPDGTVIDGEVLAWEHGAPLPFGWLQRRLGRKQVQAMLFPEVPVCLMAYDLLECDGVDLRQRTLEDRRAILAQVMSLLVDPDPSAPGNRGCAQISHAVDFNTWHHLASLVDQSRQRGVEGVMLKRKGSPYRVGRTRGDWWKWKVDPFTIDAVLIAAQLGSGRRASVYTDYTFGLWHDAELVTIAKAYSGLTDDEIDQVDRFVRNNTTRRAGPVRIVKPELVFELAFEGVQHSNRHKAGVAVRFPRIHRWRHDKKPADADDLATLQAMAPVQ